MNYSKNSDKINSERTSKLGNKTNENIQNVVSSKNVSSTSSYHSKALPSLLDWDGDTIHVNTTFLIIGNDTSSSIAYNFINDNKSKNQTVTYENETDDHIVDLNVDLKIVMMASGKIIKYDQLLLANDDKTTEQLQNYAPIDQRALSLVCSLNSNDDISVDKVEVDKSKGNCIEADTENNVENGNEKISKIVSSWNGRFRRKHATVIGGGLKGVQTAFYLCDNVLGRSPKFPRVSLVCTENGPLTRYLPRYLSNIVASKMNKAGILLNSFSVVQYIAPIENSNVYSNYNECEIFACRTYDTRTTFDFTSNLLIFAPTHVQANTNWIHINNVNLEVNKEHGGIMVNNELAACTDVYVSGDLCSFPSKLGRRRIQGSNDHDIETGLGAAKNMIFNSRRNKKVENIMSAKEGISMTEKASFPCASFSTSSINRYQEEPAVEIQIGGTEFAFVGLCNSIYETNTFWKARNESNLADNNNKVINIAERARNARLAKEKFNAMCEIENVTIPSRIFDKQHDSGFIVYIRDMEIVGIMLWKNLSKQELYEQDLRKKRKKTFLSSASSYAENLYEKRITSMHENVKRAKAYLKMPSQQRTLIAPPPPYSRSLESMEFTKHVGRYVLNLKSVEEMESYTRRYEASREAKYGLKERTLPSIPENEILYFSQGRHVGNGSWSPGQNGLSSQNTDKIYSTKSFKDAQNQSSDLLFGGNKKYAW
eukprot:g1411.t1